MLPDIFSKYCVYEPLVGCASIFKPKGHLCVTKNTNVSVKSCLIFILQRHLDLMIPLVRIQKTFPPIWRERVYLHVDLKQRITVLGTCLIEISIINTHAPSFGRLLDHNRVCNPTLVAHLYQYTCL
ncbi:hypothetical protein HanIR_Chr09g0397591 [Helianthus annuus]|nr:hypothetical protein HanIR_Chr09g0397591 [Helianthus annuus]